MSDWNSSANSFVYNRAIMPLDQLVQDFADVLFDLKRREIFGQEEDDLQAIRDACKHNGMVLASQYAPEVEKYLVKRIARLADAKIETALTAAKAAGLPLDGAILGEMTSEVLKFCNQEQHREIAFFSHHLTQPSLNNVPVELKNHLIEKIQVGASSIMETAKGKLKAVRYETMIDARKTQAVYAAALGKEWDAFISHASEDKKDFAEPLADALMSSGLRIWYDKTALSIGDVLRQQIDEGLAHSKYGIVILSHNFFQRNGPNKNWMAFLRERFLVCPD
jgi:hypothetical protein